MPVRTVVLTADSPVLQGPLVYRGGFLKATSGGAAVADLYDSTTATGQPLDSFRAATSSYDRHTDPDGVWVLRGVFFDAGVNVDSFVLFYDDDAPEDTAGARSGP